MSNINNLSEKMESLILEIDSICKEQKMKYYLVEEALVAAVRGKNLPHRRKALAIAMYGKDIRKLNRFIKKIPDRHLESLLNNPKFPGFYARYCDTRTLMYDTNRRKQPYEDCCIGINIYVLCPYQEKKGVLFKCKERVKMKWAEHMGSHESQFLLSMGTVFSRLVRFNRCFSKMLKRPKVSTNQVELYNARGQHFVFDRKKFGRGRSISVGENTFMIPNAAREIGRAMNGGNLFFGVKNEVNLVTNLYLVNFGISGNDFLDEVKEKKLNRLRDIKRVRKYLSWKDNSFFKTWNKRTIYYEYYFLTKERFGFYQELCGESRESILTMYIQKDFEALEEIFNPYISKIRAHNKKGFGLYFDKDMYVIAINMMAYQILTKEKVKPVALKNIKNLKKNVDRIPSAYFIPLHTKDKEGYTTDVLEGIREEVRAELDSSLAALVEEFYLVGNEIRRN